MKYFPLDHIMTNTECLVWFRDHQIPMQAAEDARQIERDGQLYMAVPEVPVLDGVYSKAFVEGEDSGLCAAASGEFRPTDAQLEESARKCFKYRELNFDSEFDGRMVFIRGFWQGWRKGKREYVRSTAEGLTGQSWEYGG